MFVWLVGLVGVRGIYRTCHNVERILNCKQIIRVIILLWFHGDPFVFTMVSKIEDKVQFSW